MKVDIIPAVLNINQTTQQLIAVKLHTLLKTNQQAMIGLWRAKPVNTGNRSDDQNITPGQQTARSTMPQLINLLVDRGILLNVGVCRGNVSFRLVVVVIRNEILDGIIREEFLEFTVKLGSQGFIRRKNQSWSLNLHHHVGHGKGFAGTGNPKENLVEVATANTLDQLSDGLRLIPLWLEVGL